MIEFPEVGRTGIRDVVAAGDAVDTLLGYFQPQAQDAGNGFSGGWFERFGGGGDQPEVADAITALDIVAVSTLGVDVPAKASIRLLEGDLGSQMSDLLGQIPTAWTLQDVAPEQIQPESPADQAWHLLRAEPDIGWVIAGKLLARKRPRLIPVYDDVVSCYLGRPKGMIWQRYQHELQHENGVLVDRLDQLHQAANLPETVSLLRVLDVLLWQAHHIGHQQGA